MAYILRSSFDWKQDLDAKAIIRSGTLSRLTSDEIISNLKDAGLSYRRESMLHDVRRGQAVEWSKSPDAKLRAESWFDKVYEPFRDQRNLSSREATKLWQRTVDETWETIEEAEEGKEWWEKHKEGSPDAV